MPSLLRCCTRRQKGHTRFTDDADAERAIALVARQTTSGSSHRTLHRGRTKAGDALAKLTSDMGEGGWVPLGSTTRDEARDAAEAAREMTAQQQQFAAL